MEFKAGQCFYDNEEKEYYFVVSNNGVLQTINTKNGVFPIEQLGDATESEKDNSPFTRPPQPGSVFTHEGVRHFFMENDVVIDQNAKVMTLDQLPFDYKVGKCKRKLYPDEIEIVKKGRESERVLKMVLNMIAGDQYELQKLVDELCTKIGTEAITFYDDEEGNMMVTEA